jgi:glycosyltransferase involved in cell wall biosynthesis
MRGAEVASPSISVVVPLFNKRAWVAEAVASALMQDWSPLEVIVVDDGSTDGGGASLTGFDERVRVFQQPNAGESAARNRGIAAARGDWVAFLDADDRFVQGHLRRLVELSRMHPEAAALCSGYRNFWPGGRTQERVLARLGHGMVRDFFKEQQRGLTCVGAIAIRREVLADFEEPFAVNMRFGADQDCWFRVAERWPFAYVPRIGVEIRKGVVGRVTDSDDRSELGPCYERLAERIEQGDFPSHLRRSASVLVATHYLDVATHCARRGEMARSRELVRSRRAKAHVRYWINAVLRLGAIQLGWWLKKR